MDGLLPDRATLDGWHSLADAATWGGLEVGLARCVTRQLGDPGLVSVQVLAVIPLEVFEASLLAATRGDRYLTETEKAQWRLVLSAIRVKFGAPSLFSVAMAPPTPAIPTAVATGSGGAKLKLKMSQIIDQGVDFEVEMLSGPTLQKMRAQFVIAEGDNPLEKEEVTDAQLTCLGKPHLWIWGCGMAIGSLAPCDSFPNSGVMVSGRPLSCREPQT